MLLVTGCARSGTLYIARALQALGLDVGHERCGRDGAASWVWAREAATYPAYHQQGPRPAFDLILHQVREPLATIGSLQTSMRGTWDWICEHTPIHRDASPLCRQAEYWLYWNRIAGKRAAWRYRIEALPEIFEEFTRRVGRPGLTYEAIRGVSTLTNARLHSHPTWLDIAGATPLCQQIKALAEEYGY